MIDNKNIMKTQVWMITGAGRGLGLDIAKAALAAGHKVIATGRNINKVAQAIGESDNLLVVKLDINDSADAASAVKLATDRFGSIDVLVNNAANFYAGYFEELSMKEIELQVSTSLFGPMKVTRAVLPVMRKQQFGHIITISSVAGLVGQTFCSAYSASKFGIEGWMESLQTEIEQFGINTTTVNPGFFRTELLTEDSTTFADNPIDEYNGIREETIAFWKSANGHQPGDPTKLADALIKLAQEEKPPLRFLAGADAVEAAEQVASTLQDQTNAYRQLSSSLAY
jgi:NAD(P)-dependent dehydrogenase (short-subunit alcohol dehydrogenase family)